MQNSFIGFITKLAAIPGGLERAFSSLVKVSRIPKGGFFVHAGHYPSTIGFVRKGLFRYYYTHEDGVEFYQRLFSGKFCLEFPQRDLRKKGILLQHSGAGRFDG